MEIIRYRKSSHKDKDEKIKSLAKELERLKNLKPVDYYEITKENDSIYNELNFSKNFGYAVPPLERTIEIFIDKPIEIGEILMVVGMTK